MNVKETRHYNQGWVRVWRHESATCYVYYREGSDDYIGTIEYDDNHYTTTYPNDDLEIVIQNTEHWAEQGF